MKKKKVLLTVGFLCATLLVVASDNRLRVRHYEIESEKLTEALRLVLLTDLHSQVYGKEQAKLLSRIEAQKPDFVLLGGDILDDELPRDKGFETMAALAERYPCYYVSGNHECRTGEVDLLKEQIRALGIVVLEGDCIPLEFHGQRISLCGIDDPDESGQDESLAQLDRARTMAGETDFRILLTHRPELVAEYRLRGFDLMLAGHAHGGQWRIPGLLNGLLAPHQGFFPAYAGGLYEWEDETLVVSRGLSVSSTPIPRFFNPPELVVLDLMPATEALD